MQQASNGVTAPPGPQQNGASSDAGGPHTNGNVVPEPDGNINGINGEENGATITPKVMDKTNQDIVRLIGQHLKTVGLEYVRIFSPYHTALCTIFHVYTKSSDS